MGSKAQEQKQRNGFHKARAERPCLFGQLRRTRGKACHCGRCDRPEPGSVLWSFCRPSGHRFKRLSLTDIKLPLGRGARKKTVDKAWQEASVEETFAASGWGKKLAAREQKARMTDFERFSAMVAKKKINQAARAATSSA